MQQAKQRVKECYIDKDHLPSSYWASATKMDGAQNLH